MDKATKMIIATVEAELKGVTEAVNKLEKKLDKVIKYLEPKPKKKAEK